MSASRFCQILALTSLAVVSLITSACSPTFHRDWKQAVQKSPANPSDLSGAWQGTWRSEGSGHQGRLRAIVTPHRHQPNTWHFRYHATWAKILNGSYTTQHLAEPQKDGSYKISGHHHLGKIFGGTFHYEGRATNDKFNATYCSKSDHGIFEMSRTPPSDHQMP